MYIHEYIYIYMYIYMMMMMTPLSWDSLLFYLYLLSSSSRRTSSVDSRFRIAGTLASAKMAEDHYTHRQLQSKTLRKPRPKNANKLEPLALGFWRNLGCSRSHIRKSSAEDQIYTKALAMQQKTPPKPTQNLNRFCVMFSVMAPWVRLGQPLTHTQT